MDYDSNTNSSAATPVWELRRATEEQFQDASKWGRDRTGSGFPPLDALRAVGRRKLLAAAVTAAFMILAGAWMRTTPIYYTATQSLLFSQALDAGSRAEVLGLATGEEAQAKAAASVGLAPGDVRVTAAVFGSRSLAVSSDSPDPNAASAATEAAVEVLRLRTPVGFRPQSPVSAESRHWSRMRGAILAAASLAGFLCACVAAWVLERRDRCITNAAELFELTNLPILALSTASSADEESPSHVS